MKKQGALGHFICADGKFFKFVNVDQEDSQNVYRQIELYMPATEGCYREPLGLTRDRFLLDLHTGVRPVKWAVGSTGGQLTARYKIRESDGELVSILALSGGIK